MDDQLRFACPSCTKRLKGPPGGAGKTATCPRCGTKVTIPTPVSSVPTPAMSSPAVPPPPAPEPPVPTVPQTATTPVESFASKPAIGGGAALAAMFNSMTTGGAEEFARRLNQAGAAEVANMADRLNRATADDAETLARELNAAPISATIAPPRDIEKERVDLTRDIGRIRFFGLLEVVIASVSKEHAHVFVSESGADRLPLILNLATDEEAWAFGGWLTAAGTADRSDFQAELNRVSDPKLILNQA